MVEIFKTNVHIQSSAQRIIEYLQHHFPSFRINFDLDDCDRILRIEGSQLDIQEIKSLVNEKGFVCDPIP